MLVNFNSALLSELSSLRDPRSYFWRNLMVPLATSKNVNIILRLPPEHAEHQSSSFRYSLNTKLGCR